MFKQILSSAMMMGALLPFAAQAQHCFNLDEKHPGVVICDVSFTNLPTYADLCLSTIESGVYTIRNNTPVSIMLNYIRIQNNDALPDAATAVVAAPTNPCGAALAAGSSCNIQVNLQPLSLGTFNRVLQVGIDTRQVQINATPITVSSNCTPGAPSVPGVPTIPGTPASLYQASILGATTVTNTGPTVVNGDVDISPGTTVTGFPPGTAVNGSVRLNDGTAITAHADAQTYYTALQGLACPPGNNLTGQDLGGKVLTPGVYCFSSSAQLTGALTLSGAAGSNFTFQIASTLTTATGSSVVLSGGVTNSNVNWAIGSSATLGAGTAFQGIIDAQASITLNTGASLVGRAWALTGAVTLDSNPVNPN